MALTVTIAGADKSSQIAWDSLSVEQIMGAEVDTARFMLRVYGTKTYEPEVGDEVLVNDGTQDVFGGIIVRITKRFEAGVAYVEVECADYGRILDRYLVAAEFTAQTAVYCINNLIADYVNKYKRVIATFESTETWVAET